MKFEEVDYKHLRNYTYWVSTVEELREEREREICTFVMDLGDT